jgi:hypothetical protein
MSMTRKQLQGTEEQIMSHFVSIVGQSLLQTLTKLLETFSIRHYEGMHKAYLKELR